ncbi:hypothetical protein AQI95_28900 [Streptomyces yokosukanensis]|uniref:Uncharacterized protein n=1 Tax=Streptomyces yokosukanensis TaxID=67386 RepID=A0A117Q0J1_9ACTN|nr:hypothetical protein [Streptomyces yokosukanensis]KUN02099.1 hypothetical protein AQI95_28900 [Streptomyces yokosukanensis]
MTEIPEPEIATVRIPKAALDAFAAAVDARVVATAKDDGGLDWFYAWGTREVERLEVALLPGGDEVMLRMSSDRATTIVCPIAQWYELVGRMIPPGQGPQEP